MPIILVKTKKNLKIYGTKRYHLSRLDNIKHLIKKNEIELLDCDLTDPISVRNLISKLKPEVILHLLLKVLFHLPGNILTDI